MKAIAAVFIIFVISVQAYLMYRIGRGERITFTQAHSPVAIKVNRVEGFTRAAPSREAYLDSVIKRRDDQARIFYDQYVKLVEEASRKSHHFINIGDADSATFYFAHMQAYMKLYYYYQDSRK